MSSKKWELAYIPSQMPGQITFAICLLWTFLSRLTHRRGDPQGRAGVGASTIGVLAVHDARLLLIELKPALVRREATASHS